MQLVKYGVLVAGGAAAEGEMAHVEARRARMGNFVHKRTKRDRKKGKERV